MRGAGDEARQPPAAVPARALARLLRATAEVVSSATDIDGALQWALDVVCEYTAWPVGHVTTLDPATGLLSSHELWHVDEPDRYDAFVEATRTQTFAPGTGLPGRVLATGEPAWIPDVRHDPNFPRAGAAAEVGLAAAFAFPITSSRGVEGVMEFFGRSPAPLDHELLDLIAHVGVQLGHLLDRGRADDALRESAARLAEAERIGRAGSWSWEVGATTSTWSDELYRIYGITPTAEPMTFERYAEAIHPGDRPRVLDAVRRVIATSAPWEHEYRIIRSDGALRWMHARIEVVATRDGKAARLAGHCQDVTERHVAEETRRLAQLELESHQRILERIARTDPVEATLDDLCLDIEARFEGVRCSVLLVDGKEGVLRHVAAPSLPETFCRAIDGLPIAVGSGACGTAVARNEVVIVGDTLTDPLTEAFVTLAREHDLRSVWSHPLCDSDGEVIGTFALYRTTPYVPDESEMRSVQTAGSLAAMALERGRTQAELVASATVDPLTGLANRARFLDQLNSRLRDSDAPVAVMFLDLDGFKWINDSLGHPAGDTILQEVATRLRNALEPHHLLARFGGDEFTVLLAGTRDQEIERAADRVDAAFADPFVLDGGEFFLSCCVGIAINDGPTDGYSLIRDADTAMFSAKESGRARRARFDQHLRDRAVGRVTLETELRRAIERDELVMHYQPIIDLRSGAWVGAESLVRWQHPTRGLLAPAEFIPLAEECGLIVPLGERVLDRVVRDRASWSRAGDLYVTVNVSVVQLSDPSAGDVVADALRTHALAPELLVVEVTETALMQRLDTARATLDGIVDLGVRVLIDDFGAGYSSIARLGELPVTGVKIDNRFTATLGLEPKAEEVVAAITSLAHALELHVVVEGLETAAAQQAAQRVGCEFGQGYHLAHPMPLAALERLLGVA